MLKLPSHKTKIVCTIGPSSRTEPMLKKMMKHGMNVARLNFAHGTFEEHKEDIRRIRSAAAEMNLPITILIDLPGPKIRIGKLKSEPLILKKGENVTFTSKKILGTPSLIPVNYNKLPASVSKGYTIYLNDGFIQLRVLKTFEDEVNCKVIIGGQLLSYKGLNIPKTKIQIDPATPADLKIVDFGLKEGVDTFGLSFVEKASDIIKIKRYAKKKGQDIHVVAKIEREEAVKNIEEILASADAIMIARGDLGVQIPLEDVPAVQKKIIHKANILGIPVITATQMLESMSDNIRPTRAEVTDVANAILDGTDAVMLSEETAIGKFPIESVAMMAKIAASTEKARKDCRSSLNLMEYFRRMANPKKVHVEDVISLNVIDAIGMLGIRFVMTPTHTGNTPRRISRFKPGCWILSFSHNEKTCNFLAFSYGVRPFVMKKKVDRWPDVMLDFLKDSGLAKRGERVILTEGLSTTRVGGTDSLQIITVL